MSKPAVLLVAFGAILVALGAGCIGGGDEDDIDIDGKADAFDPGFSPSEASREPWNDRNDPRLWRAHFEYNWETLRATTSGASKNIPWPDTYWPMTEDGYNNRWQGRDHLSPAELYDQAFNDWQPGSGFMALRSYTGARQPYDAAYYDQIGRAAAWAHEAGGNSRGRELWNPDGTLARCDSNHDNQIDGSASQCDFNGDGDVNSEDEEGGLEGWFGHCHAWGPAAFSQPEPQHSATVNDVTFEVGDIKALIEATFEGGGSVFLGDRCNAREFRRDEFGRVVNEFDECRDTNAGAFHVVTVNVLGRMQKSYVADVTQGYQVWNQPVRDFNITRQEEVDEAAACRILGRTDTTDYPYNARAKRFVHVQMTWRYVVEGSASTEPYVPEIDSYTRTKNFEYILELADDGTIIGGEWTPRTEIPDFLWAPTHTGQDVRDSYYNNVVTAANVLSLVQASTGEPEPEPEPEQPVEDCSDAPMLQPGTPFNETTAGQQNRYNASCAGSATSPEDVYRVVLTEPAHTVLVHIEGEYDSALYVRRSCADQASELACNDDFGGSYNRSQIELHDLQPGTYYVFVDGYSTSSSGRYEISVTVE